jgi:hypothetical protein
MAKKTERKAKSLIINTLHDKSIVKQKSQENVLQAFLLLKETLIELISEYNETLKTNKSRFLFEFNDKGATECELIYSTETLIFNVQPNIFDFDRSHSIWTNSYLQDNPLNSFSGIINIYNFLSESYKYNRAEDLGYLIARIFVNREMHYFVEGKRQLGFLYNDFANSKVNKQELKNILESAILYSLDFELLVPNYDDVSVVSVEQMKDKVIKSKLQTGKRLGFQFYADDANI